MARTTPSIRVDDRATPFFEMVADAFRTKGIDAGELPSPAATTDVEFEGGKCRIIVRPSTEALRWVSDRLSGHA